MTETDATTEIEEDDIVSANPLCQIIRVVEVHPHPNADALDLISPDGSNVNYAIVVRGAFAVGDLAVWLDAMNEPVVPTDRPVFSVIAARAKGKPTYRIRAMRLRGVLSRGLVVPYDPAWGDTDVQVVAALGVTKYVPVVGAGGGRAGGALYPGLAASGPTAALGMSRYDLVGLPKQWARIPAGAEVAITEKIHGANSAYGWITYNGNLEFRARSRSLWKKREGGGTWWEAATVADLEAKLAPYPELLVYGEIFGMTDLTYCAKGSALAGQVRFAAFDVWDSAARRWYTWAEVVAFCARTGIDTVPVLGTFGWPSASGIPVEVQALANGPTMVPGGAVHTREGIVVRWDGDSGDRVALKLVGDEYLLR